MKGLIAAGSIVLAALAAGPARASVDPDLVLRVAAAHRPPPRLSPVRQERLDAVVAHLRGGRDEAALRAWTELAGGYFGRRVTAGDVDGFVAHVLRRGVLEEAPKLLEPALAVLHARDRAAAVEDFVDEIDRALARAEAGEKTRVRRLNLGAPDPDAPGRGYTWSHARRTDEEELVELERVWSKRRIMAQEDEVAAHVRLQAQLDRHRETVKRMGTLARRLLEITYSTPKHPR